MKSILEIRLRKLPNEIFLPVDDIPIIENKRLKLLDDEKNEYFHREELSPYQKYASGSSYKLVYCKNKTKPFCLNEDKIASMLYIISERDIDLAPIVRYNPKDYFALKQ